VTHPRRRVAASVLVALVAAVSVAACGDDDTTTSAITPTTTPTGATGPEGEPPATADAPTGKPEDVAADLTSCLKSADMSVIENPSSVGTSKLQLVVDAGGVGIVYIFESEADAEAGTGAVEEEEGSIGREVEAAGQTVIAYLPPGQTLAPSEEELAAFKSCVGIA
jgi:hypothetical protein